MSRSVADQSKDQPAEEDQVSTRFASVTSDRGVTWNNPVGALTCEQVSALHQASLQILGETGVRFYSRQAVELFRQAGVSVSDDNLVRIPVNLVKWALEAAPKEITIYDREGNPAMLLGEPRSYFGVGSDCMFTYDLNTGERRRAKLTDVVLGTRLVHTLPHLDFTMSMFAPDDVSSDLCERHQMAIMLTETTKPIVFVGMELSSTVDAVEMASAVAGGSQELAQRPFIINFVNTVSPLCHNHESVERLLFAAERNVPSIYKPGKTRGLTAPMTQAGAMALANAGQLAGLVLSQLKREGAPFINSSPAGGTMDMRWMVGSYASPEGGLFGYQLARHYGLPVFGTAGCSDSKVFDAQAAAEAALTLFANVIAGAHLVHDIGYLDCATTGSLELVVLCDEIIGWLKHYFRELDVSSEALAVDVVGRLGPQANFLGTEHTLRHVRDDWQPSLFDRTDFDRWYASGGESLRKRARQRISLLLDQHRVAGLSDNTAAAIQAVIDDRQITNVDGILSQASE